MSDKFGNLISNRQGFNSTIVGLLVFLCPFLPYWHLLVVNHEPTNYLWTTFKNFFKISYSFDLWLYYLLNWLFILALFFIWRKKSDFRIKLGINALIVWSVTNVVNSGLGNGNTVKFIIKGLGAIVICFLFIQLCRKHLMKDKDLGTSFFLTVLLLSIPFITNTAYLLPEGANKIEFLIFEIESLGFSDASTFFYVFCNKTCVLLCLTIWFFLEKRWWRFAILSPILLVSNQVYNLFAETNSLDEFELYQSGPYLLGLAVILIVLAKIADNQKCILDLIEKKYVEIEQLTEKKWSKRQVQIEEEKARLKSKTMKTEELIALRKKLERELGTTN